MKIKNLFSMLAMAGMLFATSCSQDEVIGGASAGDFVDATFTIGTADGMGTRAIGDGTTVDKVACTVYDADGEELKDLYQIVDITNKTATYSVRLAKGQNYRVAFFAYNEAADAYDVTDLKNIEVKADQLSNIEGRDAFTAYYDVTTGKTMNAFEETITLYRPFAQLNLGIDARELEDAKKAGIVVAKSKIVVSNVYNAFSAYDDAVVATDVTEEMVFELNAIPTEKLYVYADDDDVVDGEYTYLALNYLLVGDKDSEKALTDVEFIWEGEDGETNDPTTKFINIPVQRNYRTNIIGKLLTNPATFNIVIDEKFKKPDYIVDEDGTVNKTVSTLAELQAALDAAVANNKTIITLAASISGNATVIEKAGATILINGAQNVYDGTFTIYGGSKHENATTIFKNMKFETSNEITFIYADASANGDYRRYPDNIIVEDCSFKAIENTAAVNKAVGLKVRSLDGKLTITNTTAEGMHTLLQTTSCDKNTKEILIDDVTITNGKNGLSFRTSDAVTVSNTTINTNGYGIRVDGTTNYATKVQDCNITASYPVAVTNMNGNDYSIKFEGNNTLVSDKLYQVIITNSKDEDKLEIPTGTYTLTGAEGFIVYPNDVVAYANGTDKENGTALYNAINAAKAGQNIYVQEGTYEWKDNSTNRFANKSFQLIGKGDVKIKVDTKGLVINATADNGTVVDVKNITIESGSQAVYAKGYATVNLYDCTLKTDNDAAILLCSADACTNGVDVKVNAYNVTVDDGDVVYLNANPCTSLMSAYPDVVSYAHFTYEGGNISTCKPQDITRSTGSNLFVNGVALPAYE